MIEPLGYLEFLNLMANAWPVLTDFGSIQEETTILGVPFGMLRAGPSTGSGQAPRRPPGPQAVGRGVHRAGGGRRGGRELPPGGRAGDKGTRKQGDSQALKAFPVLGTCPEPIKLAPVIQEPRRHHEWRFH